VRASKIGFLLVTLSAAVAAPPQVYRHAAYESPVQGGPDDLLLIPGYGFATGDIVVYRAVRDSARHVVAPRTIPMISTAAFGLAPIVSFADVPYSLTVKLPQVLRRGQSYDLWVRTARGEWSKAVHINDARPLWISPAYVYVTGRVASMPREIKIVGRNLQPSAGHATEVRLIGPQTYTGTATSTATRGGTIDQYVTQIFLPASLQPGRYRIQVNRDGASWVELQNQSLQVLPDAPRTREYSVNDPKFGGCRPNDGLDDTQCILRAIAAAARNGGGVVEFGPGTWDLINGAQRGLFGDEGVLVPDGVQLRGAGAGRTRVIRHRQWSESVAAAAFTLMGHNVVSGFRFRDLQVYRPQDSAAPFLQLGEDFQRIAMGTRPAAANDIVITGNTFDKTFVAIGDGGLPIRRLFITYNTFGAYSSALELAGNRYNVADHYRIDDSVIDFNTFEPGSKLDMVAKTGTLASEIGAGHHLDFSNNTADGSATKYLYAASDPRGWRAAFFWNMNGNLDEVLVAQNTATCTGDKIGDGEAIAYDNNGNTFAFATIPTVANATRTSVSVLARPAARQNNRDVPAGAYYVGHWVQIVSGPGLGQVRKITGYHTDSETELTTFNVSPDWDVMPIPGRSRMTVGREIWQTYTIDNQVDERRPLCQKSNRSRPDAGVIGMWAQSADSVIAGNRQYDSDGILVQEAYIPPKHLCANCTMQTFLQSFLEIRDNVVDGKYDWRNDCSASGIEIGMAAAPWHDAAPPTVGFGVSIAHNTIRHADAQQGGAVAQIDSWYAGPAPYRWALSDSMLIDHNAIEDIDEPRVHSSCGTSHPGIGIKFPDSPVAWRTVLYANSCRGVSVPIRKGEVDSVRVCPSSAKSSCECP